MGLTTEQTSFIATANEFCRLVEEPVGNKVNALLALRDAVLALYAAALQFPDFGDSSSSRLLPSVPTDEYNAVAKRLGAQLARDYFWFFYEPFKEPIGTPVTASLSDGLADIWRDLKPGLDALNRDEFATNDVFWEWKFGFDHHWGDHAVDSIWAIHKLMRDYQPAR